MQMFKIDFDSAEPAKKLVTAAEGTTYGIDVGLSAGGTPLAGKAYLHGKEAAIKNGRAVFKGLTEGGIQQISADSKTFTFDVVLLKSSRYCTDEVGQDGDMQTVNLSGTYVDGTTFSYDLYAKA